MAAYNAYRVHLPSSSFTRPNNATPYASGQLVANSTTAGSVVPLKWQVAPNAIIRRMRLTKSTNSVTTASFRVHIYVGTSPTTTAGDAVAWAAATTGALTEAGFFTFTFAATDQYSDGASMQSLPSVGTEMSVTQDALNGAAAVYGLVECTSAYTPGANEVFTAQLEVWF